MKETNGDTIRNMTNEELSELFGLWDMSPTNEAISPKEWLEWLNEDSELKWRGKKSPKAMKHYQLWFAASITAAVLGITAIIISLTK